MAGLGLHMVDFHAEGSCRAVLNMLHRVWLWLTTGAGLIATAVGIVTVALASAVVSGLHYRDHAEEGRVILQRIFDLTALQAGSQSALGCLDVSPGDPLEEICERTIFANPQTVASANAFVAARFSVLGEALPYATAVRSPSAEAVVSLRQVVENDPFGIAAHVLAARYGCSASQCSAFAMLADISKVVANLNARTYENLVSRYAPSWQGQGFEVPAVSSLLGQGPPVVAAVLGSSPNLRAVPTGAPPKGLNVPPASSIPAVSIMTEEPSAPPPTGNPRHLDDSAMIARSSPAQMRALGKGL
jgi:hypothetical protein